MHKAAKWWFGVHGLGFSPRLFKQLRVALLLDRPLEVPRQEHRRAVLFRVQGSGFRARLFRQLRVAPLLDRPLEVPGQEHRQEGRNEVVDALHVPARRVPEQAHKP